MDIKERLKEVIEKIIYAHDLQDSVSWYYCQVAREFYNIGIEFSLFAEVFEPIIAERVKDIFDLENKKCFLSLPITNREVEAIELCDKIKAYFEKYFPTCTLYVPFDVAPKKDMPTSYYMGKDVEQLMECDIMIQSDDWEDSKGCTVENCVADVYNIEKIPLRFIYYF